MCARVLCLALFGVAVYRYDVLVDLPSQSLQVADRAKADLSMGDYHKNLGGFLAAAAVNPDAGVADLVKGLATKTKQLFDKLNKLKAAGALDLAALEAQEGVSRSFARCASLVPLSPPHTDLLKSCQLMFFTWHFLLFLLLWL